MFSLKNFENLLKIVTAERCKSYWMDQKFKVDDYEDFSHPLHPGSNTFRQEVRGSLDDDLDCKITGSMKWNGTTYDEVVVISYWGR